jgi:Fe-S cluster assembly protein SufD
MSVAVKEKETITNYLEGNFSAHSDIIAIAELNQKGAANMAEFPFPTKKDEEWRFTDLRSISRNHYVPLNKAGAVSVGDISKYYLPEAMKSRLVFVNGEFDAELSVTEDLPDDVIIGTIAEQGDSKLINQHLGAYTNYDEDQDVFAALNDAHFKDGAFIYVPKEVKVEAPIHILNVFTDAKEAFFATPRVLFVGEKFSETTIVEDHIGLADNAYLNVPVAEFKLYESAHVHHARIQRDSKKSITHITADCQPGEARRISLVHHLLGS